MTNNNEVWDWCNNSFCKDISSDWSGLEIKDFYEGIGRLLHETQMLTEILIVWQARNGNLFKKIKNGHNFEFSRENIESSLTVAEIRKSPLGKLVNVMKKTNKFAYPKDENTLYEILVNRNHFVHEFFANYALGNLTEDDLNRECKRLKKSINTVVKFNNRYLGEIIDDLELMDNGE